MWTTEARATAKASPETVWELWSNVDGWKEWDPAVEWSSIGGPFAEGTRCELKPKGGPKAKAVLTDVRPGEGFSDRTRLPLANLGFSHEVERVGEGTTRITHRIEISGPLSFLFARLMGTNMEKGLPEAVRNLARLAEEREDNGR